MVGLCVLNLVRTTIYGKIKNESRFSFSYQPRSPIDEATRQSVWQAGNPLELLYYREEREVCHDTA